MSLPTHKELISVVYGINVDFQNQVGKEYIGATFVTDGFVDIINFAGIEIWNSEADDRDYLDEEKDIKEPIDQYIKRCIQEELSAIASFVPIESNIAEDIADIGDWINVVTGRPLNLEDTEYDKEDLVVRYKNISYGLNYRMAQEKGLNKSDIRAIRDLHVQKLKIFEDMEKEDSPYALRQYAKLIEHIEYSLQNLWRFDKDKSWHEWYAVPKCLCPKMDNTERRGTSYQIISSDCPIHGDKHAN